MKATVLYFTSSGNTRQLAERLADQLRKRELRVLLTELDEAKVSDLSEADLVLVGSPAWTGERIVPALEEFLQAHAEYLRGKQIGFFGSYDWGEGLYFCGIRASLERAGACVDDTPLVWGVSGDEIAATEIEVFLARMLPGCRPTSAE